MSHAEALHTRHPAEGATDAIVAFVGELRYDALSDEVRHYARRHLLDTVGVMIAGAGGDVATQAEAALAAVRPAGHVPVPGRARRADLLDAAFLGGTAAHGIELDDGYTKGSVHPGLHRHPVGARRRATRKKASGKALIEAIVAGYETVTAIGGACHPALRHRGFHPTGAVSVFGAAMATGKLRGLDRAPARQRHGHRGVELGRACSPSSTAAATSSACTPATRRARACRRRCWPSRASKARPACSKARDGFMQAFAYAGPEDARPIRLPPAVPFGITDCYIKPNPCCRHIQPATEALIGAAQRREHLSRRGQARRGRDLPHRRRARAHRLGRLRQLAAELPLPDVAGAALPRHQVRALRRGRAQRSGLAAARGRNSRSARHTRSTSSIPKLRPARVTVTTARGKFTRQADEALGSRLVPLDDDGLKAKFRELVEPVHGAATAQLAAQLWDVEALADVSPLVEALAKPAR